MEEFNKLNKEEKVITLCLFAIKTECVDYNVDTILECFIQTSDDTKAKYIKQAKDFIFVRNLYHTYANILPI